MTHFFRSFTTSLTFSRWMKLPPFSFLKKFALRSSSMIVILFLLISLMQILKQLLRPPFTSLTRNLSPHNFSPISSPRGCYFSRGRPSHGRQGGHSGRGHVQCQVCSKFGHIATHFYHRFDPNYMVYQFHPQSTQHYHHPSSTSQPCPLLPSLTPPYKHHMPSPQPHACVTHPHLLFNSVITGLLTLVPLIISPLMLHILWIIFRLLETAMSS